MIAEIVGNRLLHYDQNGILLNTINLNDFGISYIVDARIRGSKLVVLEKTLNGRKWVNYLSLDGSLLKSDEIPNQWFLVEGTPSLGEPLTLESALTGLAIDCEGEVVLEITGGSTLYRLFDVLNNPNPSQIPNGYPCNGKLYSILNSQKPFAKIKAETAIFESRLTKGFGGLSFLEIYQDGSFYVERNDVVNDQTIQVDQTIHYIGANGAIQGMARIPLSEFYFPIMRSITVSSSGEVFVLLPRPNSLDIIHLIFYKELPALNPDAVPPNLSLSTQSP